MLVIGLTGSIGMGKSTTADMFRMIGVQVHDSDAAVHAIYRGPDARKIETIFPGVLLDGVIDRNLLGQKVLGNVKALRQLEELVHPLVEQSRSKFLEASRACGERVVVLDVPLLFEIGGVTSVDAVAVVSASNSVQRARVLSRPGMTEERFRAILARQVPDSVKRSRAHFIIDSGFGFFSAKLQVNTLLKCVGYQQPSWAD